MNQINVLSDKKIYKCSICGREFEKAQQIGGHVYYCRAKQQGIDLRPGDRFTKGRGWAKGLTKETNASLKSMAEKQSKLLKSRFVKNGSNDPFIAWMKDPIKLKKMGEKVSKSLKRGYATGAIIPAKNSSHGRNAEGVRRRPREDHGFPRGG